MNVLVTGGCGFIGSNLIKLIRKTRPAWKIINLDKLTYAGNLESVAEFDNDPQHVLVRGDIGDRVLLNDLFERHPIDYVMHLAAESHVDRSIAGPELFIQTNVLGTQTLLEATLKAKSKVKRFLAVSTDEVYGSLGPTGAFTELSPLVPSSPYSASKASSDLIALAYHRTFGVDVVVTRCSNNYGPLQFPEKLIPLMVVNALKNLPLPIYGDGANVRDWLHVEDHCQALLLALTRGRAGEVYNIGGGSERRNIEIVQSILAELKKPSSLIHFVVDRLGHDRRYAIDPTKIKSEMGWAPTHSFERGLKETVQWYVNNSNWWERVLSGAYRGA